jgi:Protein of unknown function (DUF1524)
VRFTLEGMRLWRRLTALALLASTASGCASPVASVAASGPATSGMAAPASATAAEALRTLPVKGRAPMTGYSRDQFGPAWADTDHNGCDQRNQVLARDMTGVEFKPGTHNCVVMSGRLVDPYTGKVIVFRRGQGTSEDVQIDHVVALGDAWQKGAQQLDPATRERLATDLLNLLAVDGPTNQQKSDGDAATWLPPNKAVRCAYLARQVAVKARYRLWVTGAERDAITGVLANCPNEPLPATDKPPTTAPH